MKPIKKMFVWLLPLLLGACGNETDAYDATGVFEATEVLVPAEATGRILRLDVQEGETVEAGEPLGLIDTVQLALKRQQLAAAMRAAGSRRVDVSLQVAALRRQIAVQQSELSRFEKLVAANAASRKQTDDIRNQIAVLENQLQAQTTALRNANNSLDGETDGLEAQLAQLDDQLLKSVVSTPVSGTILAKYVEAGEWAMPGKPLLKVADLRTLFLRAYVTADQLAAIKIGQSVNVFTDATDGGRRPHKGTVAWIASEAEFTPKTVQTRNERANLVYAIKLAVHNDGTLKIGMYGEVQF